MCCCSLHQPLVSPPQVMAHSTPQGILDDVAMVSCSQSHIDVELIFSLMETFFITNSFVSRFSMKKLRSS